MADAQVREQAARQQPSNSLEAMAAQVKEIMPHVPLAAIMRDLGTYTCRLLLARSQFCNVFINTCTIGRTNSIDATIANIVEGVVPFVPEPIKTGGDPTPRAASAVSAGSSASSSSSPSTSSAQVQVSSSTFGKSANERCLSLQERKQRILHEARRRYCEKHGINLANMNSWMNEMHALRIRRLDNCETIELRGQPIFKENNCV